MNTVLHRASTRGHTFLDWLDSYHTFSFDQYYDPARIHFGALRVLNDDTIAPGTGFETHPHKNMEIITLPLKGHLRHGDSMEHSRVITPGFIQTMSAGTGIWHSEMNGGDDPVQILQIWVFPRKNGTPPRYQDYDIRPLQKKNEPYTIVAPDGSTRLPFSRTVGSVCSTSRRLMIQFIRSTMRLMEYIFS